jgi:hypothetical protein
MPSIKEFVTFVGFAAASPRGASAEVPTAKRCPSASSHILVPAAPVVATSRARSANASPPDGVEPINRWVAYSAEPGDRRRLHALHDISVIALRSGRGSGRFAMPTARPRG